MTSLSSILSAGLSSLRASQTAMSVASQNIANANTPGYVRTQVTFAPNTSLGPGAGVSVSSIQRAADRFLATASYLAEGARGASTARAEILARAQAAFGDPASDTSLFATLDDFWSALQVLGVDPSSTLRRDDVVGALQSAYAEMQSVSTSIERTRQRHRTRTSHGAIARGEDGRRNIRHQLGVRNHLYRTNPRSHLISAAVF
jgi:flagellar hook-associated protein 1 FlgK